MAALMARRDGARPVLNAGRVARPCQPEDVVRCLDRLYRQRRIDLNHVRTLRRWGERQRAPDPVRHSRDHRTWSEAINRLSWPLQQRGIVVTSTVGWMWAESWALEAAAFQASRATGPRSTPP